MTKYQQPSYSCISGSTCNLLGNRRSSVDILKARKNEESTQFTWPCCPSLEFSKVLSFNSTVKVTHSTNSTWKLQIWGKGSHPKEKKMAHPAAWFEHLNFSGLWIFELPGIFESNYLWDSSQTKIIGATRSCLKCRILRQSQTSYIGICISEKLP